MTDLATARHAWVTARAGGSTDAENDAAGEYIRLLETHAPIERVTYDGFGAPIVHGDGEIA